MRTITDWGTAIWQSFVNAMNMIISFIPKLIGFLVILLVGWIVAKAISKAVTWLCQRFNVEAAADRIGLHQLGRKANMHMDVSEILGKIVYWFVFLIFLVPAFDSLGLGSISSLLGTIVSYIPNVFVAVILLFLGGWIGTIVADVIRNTTAVSRMGNPNIFANIARIAIIFFAAIVALYQLRIAPAILQTLFTAIVGALALAFGLAFGLGGRESAQHWLRRGEEQLTAGSSTTPTESRKPGGNAGGGGRLQSAASAPADEQLRKGTFTQKPYNETPPYKQ
ncbi:putative transporter (transmembrane protein) [Thermosporothrix hazakensis]|jgi:small-conductance mechanosensitive channel|uniref:Putative transporter (Transmembrane protein) n=1 Tax=Thermosporothrix hazakensis TaxID=644383 RepID=A0A326U338_THEHA|nr:hypothetical protein [Thermosporothrix hazakensis]PZW26314.1 putative transporter (transmembrane protein) [Thermosporothrix hazakensis]GCE48735.1 hypothetical protein KTH_36040 [Thermosporothrix hazakensis]